MIIIDAPKLSHKMRNRSDDCLLPNLRERVAGAPTCSRIAYENATLQQVENVAKRGIRGARCDLRPLRCREVALEPVQQTISPSISLLLTTSSVSVWRTASRWRGKPSASM